MLNKHIYLNMFIYIYIYRSINTVYIIDNYYMCVIHNYINYINIIDKRSEHYNTYTGINMWDYNYGRLNVIAVSQPWDTSVRAVHQL